jgi:hypothetical protein
MAATETVKPVCECIADSRPLLIDGEKVPAAGGLGPLPPTPISPSGTRIQPGTRCPGLA